MIAVASQFFAPWRGTAARQLLRGCVILLAGLPLCSLAQETAPAPTAATETPTLRDRIKDRLEKRAAKNDEQPEAKTEQSAAKGAAPVKITKPGDYTFSFDHNGLNRLYRVHVPANYSALRPTPLVLSLHGGGGSMDYQANDGYYGQITESEQRGHIVVFPNGYSRLASGKLATWNAGNCCGTARDENIDDVGFMRALLARLRLQLNIDGQRIFANGMSNGGLMSYRLACEMSDVFRAIAAVAGTDNTRSCAPARPVSVLHIHARDDERVLFEGGAGWESDKVTQFVSVPDTVTKWVRLNGCAATPRRVFENDGAYCDAYSGCRNAVEVRLCVTAAGGHSWPGASDPRGDKTPSTAISATDMIADFFGSR